MAKQLKGFLSRGRTLENKRKILNGYKDQELFRIDMKHLLGSPYDLVIFSRAVTDLADVILEEAYDACHRHLKRQYGRPLLSDRTVCPFAICGLGKFGGREMGYASDIELLFIYGGAGRTQGRNALDSGDYFERLAQEIINFIEARREGIFQIDVRLRPHGQAGALANSMGQLRSYYSPKGEAAPFERQALTKLRWVAGDEALGHQVESLRDHFVYSGQPWDLMTALHLRQRQIKELVKPGAVNVKYSPGGVIDIEYAAQYLQIMHGRDHAALRCTATLEALKGLRLTKIISKTEYDDLHEAYLFLRALIDALRMVRGNARDLVLPERTSQEFKFLARRLGYMGGDWEQGARELDEEIRHHMQKAHHFFSSRFENI
jgi:glutamate-ammonia-ligase adenylyltransferase